MAKKRGKRGRPPAKSAAKAKSGPPAATAGSERRVSRAERWEAEKRAKRRRSKVIRIAAGAVAAALVVGVVAWQLISRRNAQQIIAAMTSGDCRYDTRSDPGRVNEHGDNPTFRVDPPSGGVHSPSAARAGTYSEQNAPPDGEVVHALEHGFIAISYRPDLAARDVATLENIADEFDDDVLLLPRPTLDVPVAATAWHRRLLCSEVEPASVRKFVEAYRGKGPEKVPREVD